MDLVLVEEDQIKSGTLSAILDTIAPGGSSRASLTDVLLLTFPRFTTPELLLLEIQRRCIKYSQLESQVSLLATGIMLKAWISSHFFSCSSLIPSLSKVIQLFPKIIRNSLQNSLSNALGNRSRLPLRPPPHQSLFHNDIVHSLLEIPSQDLAAYFSQVDESHFQDIDHHVYIEKNFLESTVIKSWMVNSDQRILFIIFSIVKCTNVQEASRVLIFWIQVGADCLRINNFHCLSQITLAFQRAPISRLKECFSNLPIDSLSSYEKLKSITSPNMKYKEYFRNGIVAVSHPPAIPLMQAHFEDLQSLEINPDLLENGHINFEKMKMLKERLSGLQIWLGHYYPPFENTVVTQYIEQQILTCASLSDQDLFSLSLKLEPMK